MSFDNSPDLFNHPPRKTLTAESAVKTIAKAVGDLLGLKKTSLETPSSDTTNLSAAFSDLNPEAVAKHIVEGASPFVAGGVEAANNLGYDLAAAILGRMGKSPEEIQAHLDKMQQNQLENVDAVQRVAEFGLPLIAGQLKRSLEPYDGVGGKIVTSLVDELVTKITPAYEKMRGIISNNPKLTGSENISPES